MCMCLCVYGRGDNRQQRPQESTWLPDGVITERRCQSAAEEEEEEQKGSGRQERSVEQQAEAHVSREKQTPFISQKLKKSV